MTHINLSLFLFNLSVGMSFLNSLRKGLSGRNRRMGKERWVQDEEGVSQVLLKILGENLKGTGAEMTRGVERKRK